MTAFRTNVLVSLLLAAAVVSCWSEDSSALGPTSSDAGDTQLAASGGTAGLPGGPIGRGGQGGNAGAGGSGGTGAAGCSGSDAGAAVADAASDVAVVNPPHCPAQVPTGECVMPDAELLGCRYDTLICYCFGAWKCQKLKPGKMAPGSGGTGGCSR